MRTNPGPGDIDVGLDWSRCGTPTTPEKSAPKTVPVPAAQVIHAQADSAELDKALNRATLEGHAQLDDGSQTLRAERLVYDRQAKQVTASGGILLSRPDLRLAGTSATLNLNSGDGQIADVEYRVPSLNARGTADVATISGKQTSHFENISFTTCRPGQDDWFLTARALTLDHAEGLGTAKDARLTFLDLPLGYLPTLTFPIDKRRRSGVLIPSAGISGNTGAMISVPYYLNLAPNYDATLTPRLMSRRGFSLGTEFRFLSTHYRGDLAAEILPYDMAFENGKPRGSLDFKTLADWSQRFEGRVDFNYASDSRFFEDLGGDLATTSARQLERVGSLRYHGDYWDLLGQVQHFQTLDRSIPHDELPYSRYPQLLYLYDRPNLLAHLGGQMSAEYVYFWKNNATTGHRVDLKPGISLPLRRPWGYLEPTLGARYTAYQLRDAEQTGLTDKSPDRLLGIASIDAGLFFDRPIHWLNGFARQTLEPRLYYLYVPRVNQDDLPVFDTTELDFTFDNLFRDNRFNGADRQGDANQLTLALTSRVIEQDSGAERLRASVGQVFYFADRTVTLPDKPQATTNRSAIVADLLARLTQTWQARGGIQWDPDNGDVDQGYAQASYRDSDRRIFNASYRFRENIVDQTDLAFIWPVSNSTRLIGRWNYSLLDDRTLEAVAGVEYGRCCWRVRTLLRQYTDSDDGSHNLAFWLQLELNGLGEIGTNVEEFLTRGIYGYRVDD